MKYRSILVGIIVAFLAGCVNFRTMEVEVERIQIDGSSASQGIAQKDAEELFREVIAELGLTIDGPRHLSPEQVEYGATSPVDPRVTLGLRIDRRIISYHVAIFQATKSEIPRIRGMAKHITDALDRRGIPYKSAMITTVGPS